MAEAGSNSPHLEREEQEQAADHAAPAAMVIHEIVRAEGEVALKRRSTAVAWSGLAAGLSMGFSFVCLALLKSALPDTPWAITVASVGYTVGFVITILGRQELFTESTLTAMLPLLVKRDMATFLSVLRFWAIVLAANLVGTTLFALLIVLPDVFPAPVHHAMAVYAHEATSGAFVSTLIRAVLAGWIIALMAWLLPSARSARLFVIMLLTYVVALGGFTHLIAGSVEAAYAVFKGIATLPQYAFNFLLPTLLGNSIGGVALVALLNHAPLSEELQKDAPAEAAGSRTRKRRASGNKS